MTSISCESGKGAEGDQGAAGGRADKDSEHFAFGEDAGEFGIGVDVGYELTSRFENERVRGVAERVCELQRKHWSSR